MIFNSIENSDKNNDIYDFRAMVKEFKETWILITMNSPKGIHVKNLISFFSNLKRPLGIFFFLFFRIKLINYRQVLEMIYQEKE